MYQKLRRYPHLYEINTYLFLRRLEVKYQRPLTLETVPDEEWQALARQGFDLVWLMGVWQRSPASREQALRQPALRREFDRVLPGWREADVGGSPYAVYSYTPDPGLGQDLAPVKANLNRAGLGLVLDFVPGHLARDHPWVFTHPDWLVRGTPADVAKHPDWFFSPDGQVYFAHGRDPNFPPWTDTVQVNLFSSGLRQAFISELQQIARLADGVRCDMAMLVLNDVFGKVWEEALRDSVEPGTDFWADAIPATREVSPGFIFLAEAYWEMEGKLQELGFDFAYDKVFYDQICHSRPDEISRHLTLPGLDHERGVHFIENHDEPRAVTALGRERSRAAAAVLATIPGLRLFHNGQLEGKTIRVPVQLVREPEETVDGETRDFYLRLLGLANEPVFHEGEWQPLTTEPAWAGNQSHRNLLTWTWRSGQDLRLVAVNYSPGYAQARLRVPGLVGTGQVEFQDSLGGVTYLREASEVGAAGLFIELAPWRAHIFRVTGSLLPQDV